MPRYNLEPLLKDIFNYYVIEKHTIIETSNKFNCGPDAMKLFLQKHKLIRESSKKTYLKEGE